MRAKNGNHKCAECGEFKDPKDLVVHYSVKDHELVMLYRGAIADIAHKVIQHYKL